MIDEARTLEVYGYTSNVYAQGSHKPVVAVCVECGKVRPVEKRHYSELCFACASRAPERCHKLSIANSGTNNSMYGKSPPLETREKLRTSSKSFWDDPARRDSQALRMKGNKYREGVKHTPETKAKMSAVRTGTRVGENHPLYGKSPTMATRRKFSATRQGISYDEWEGFATDSPYCPKFNEACRESNRVKYDRRCFLSDMTEDENGKKLSVHHIDMNKQQGCDGYTWKLVPLSVKWHNRVHTSLWMARIQYLLNHVWNPGRDNVIS